MKYHIMLTAGLLLLSGAALADNNNQHNNTGVSIQDGFNTGTINNNSGAGAGATNLSNKSSNVNVNTAKGGSAYQHQGQSQSIKNSGNSHSSSRSSSKSEVDGSGNSSNSYINKNPVATAYSAQLVAADDTCMGSSTAGGQGVGFGLSVGSTWKDTDCVRRKDARELHNMGQKLAAIALLCKSEDVAEAMATAGTPCPSAKVPSKIGALSPASGSKANEYPSQRTRFDW